MLNLGGVDCDAEFAQFLIANPTLEQIPPIDPSDPAYYYQRYVCTDGGQRFYQAKPITARQYADNLIAQLGYGELSTTTVTGLHAYIEGLPPTPFGQGFSLVFGNVPGATQGLGFTTYVVLTDTGSAFIYLMKPETGVIYPPGWFV